YWPESDRTLHEAPTAPTVILVAGINGSGKTTSVAKLAYLLQQQDKNILQRLQSYMRQMDTLAFLQPKIKSLVREISDNIENIENQDTVQQVVSTFLNTLKRMNAEDGIIEEWMRKLYSQAITVRVLADPIKPGRNLLQNAAFAEDRTDLFDPRNKPLTEEDQEYLETFVQQDIVMMSDWAFSGEEPLNLPFIGQKRLGIDKVTKWVQRHTQYPASDSLNTCSSASYEMASAGYF
ncbi:hypothetical protein LCGC14_1311520, partial [marine sediment metagenome]